MKKELKKERVFDKPAAKSYIVVAAEYIECT